MFTDYGISAPGGLSLYTKSCTPSLSVQQHQKRWDEGVNYLERETFDAFLQLPADQRKIIREVILTFAKANEADGPERKK